MIHIMQAKHGGKNRKKIMTKISRKLGQEKQILLCIVYKENNEAFNFTTNFCLTPRDAQLL